MQEEKTHSNVLRKSEMETRLLSLAVVLIEQDPSTAAPPHSRGVTAPYLV